MKKVKNIAIIVVFVCCCIFLVHHFLIGNWSSSNIKRYIEMAESKDALPKIEELGSYSDIEFKYYRKNMLMFFSNAYTLRVSYDAENYRTEKEKFSQKYVFETETLYDDGGYGKKPYFEMDFFSFKLLSYENYELLSYPHDIVFIGFSDEKNEISIVHYYDFDLDYIDCSFPEFLEEECGWE